MGRCETLEVGLDGPLTRSSRALYMFLYRLVSYWASSFGASEIRELALQKVPRLQSGEGHRHQAMFSQYRGQIKTTILQTTLCSGASVCHEWSTGVPIGGMASSVVCLINCQTTDGVP